MHQTMSLTLQTWQGLYRELSVAFSNSKNSCMTSNRLDSKCNSKFCTSSMPGSNQNTVFKKPVKFSQELQVLSWLMSRRKLIQQDSIEVLGRKGCIWH